METTIKYSQNKLKPKTKVKFLYNEAEQDLYALFPYDSYFSADEYQYFAIYSHIGQHSTCILEYALNSIPAKIEQYKALIEELISIGYELEVI